MSDTLTAALYSIPADDRDTWVQVGMAIKSELGDGGFDLWDGWSRQSDRYKATDAHAVWRSIKQYNGGITIGTLYHTAKEHGWAGDMPVLPEVTPTRRQAERQAREDAETVRRQQEAAAQALRMMEEAEYTTHPYLSAKGFPDMLGLVLNEALLVPMRDAGTDDLCTLQKIDEGGGKRFLPGGRAGSTVHRLGRSRVRWYCEGYATGLSVRKALQHQYRRDEVVVCFSADNIAKVAHAPGYVVADHDKSDVGRVAALKTGLPHWMPPDVGTDANDWYQKRGVKALADALRGMLT